MNKAASCSGFGNSWQPYLYFPVGKKTDGSRSGFCLWNRLVPHVFFPVDFKSDGGHQDGHEGADEVEDAIGQVGDGGHAEHGGLGHTAGVPRHEHGDDGGGVFYAAAQQTTFQSALVVKVAEEVAGEDDGDVLVAGGQVEEQAGAHGGADYADGAAGHADKDLGDGREHAAAVHHTAKAHGADDEPDGIHHTAHAARSHKVIEQGVAGLDGGMGGGGQHDALERLHGIEAVGAYQLAQDVGLGHGQGDGGHQGGGKEGDDGGQTARDEQAGDEGHQQQPRTDVEGVLQGLSDGQGIGFGSGRGKEACHAEGNHGNGHRGHRGDHHVFDVGEEGHFGGGGCQHGGVAHQGNLVAEVGTGDDGTGYPAVFKAQGTADAHQGDADGGNGGPGGAGEQGDDGGDDAGSGQEDGGVQDLHPIINQGGDDAAGHPGAGYGSDEEQDDERRRGTAHVGDDGVLEYLPLAAVEQDGQGGADGRGGQEGQLAASGYGIGAEEADGEGETEHQEG